MMNVFTLLIALVSLPRLKFKKSFFQSIYGDPIDLLVILFFLANAVSLVAAKRIEDIIPFRLLCSGVIVFFLIRVWTPDEKLKRIFIHALGIASICIASLSILQAVFPTAINRIAEDYFGGRLSYGLSLEYQRGRLLHWGSVILIFPFYYASLVLLKPFDTFKKFVYLGLGSSVLALSMIMSNFRWTFVVFVVITMLMIKLFYYYHYVSKRWLFWLGILASILLVFGLLSAKLLFGYNLLERFLLANQQRDVAESLGRTMLFDQGINVFFSSPITGAGSGNYYSLVDAFQHFTYFSIFDQFEITLVPIASHNELLTILAETGVAGFLSWLMIMYVTLKRMRLTITQWREQPLINVLTATSLAMSFGAYALYTLFENIFPQNIIYLLVIVGMSHMWFGPKKTNI